MVVHLDVTGLEPPEPLIRILDTLADLPEGEELHVRLSRDPVPLYPMLREMGYRWTRGCQAGGLVELFIYAE